MKRRALLFAAVLIPMLLLQAAYTYYYSDLFTTIDLAKWTKNGTVTGTPTGLTGTNGTLISSVAVPDGSSDYEAKTTISFSALSGIYQQYLRATSDSNLFTSVGTFYCVDLRRAPITNIPTLTVYKRQSGVITSLLSVTVSVTTPAVLATSIRNDGPYPGLFIRLGDLYWNVNDTNIATGKPGVGIYQWESERITRADLGPIDRIAPSPVALVTLGIAPFPERVDLQWPAPPDDANGSGIWGYFIRQNGVLVGTTRSTSFSHSPLTPATSYTYTIQAMDNHGNTSSQTSFNVTTPPFAQTDPRRIGVRPTGAYWGALGEQIDMLSGNLNYTLPLLKAVGRGSSGGAFSLNYNSQLWRQDAGGTWKLGADVGYGFGFRLLAGSITPVWSDPYTLTHHIFTDSSGAEFKLDLNDNGVWRGTDGSYLNYSASNQRLYFNDGSFWVMGSVSGSTEQDAGTRYPTIMQDSNGNQVLIRYKPAIGSGTPDTSARISEIEDVRAKQVGAVWRTFTFTYNTDAIPHLTGITNEITTGESYTFAYSTSQNLYSPFSPPLPFGTAQMLQTVTVTGLGLSHTFEFANSSGELTRVILPYQGDMRWTYTSFTFSGNRTLREVQQRQLTKAAGAGSTTYPIIRDASDSTRVMHSSARIDDPSGNGQRYWAFSTTANWTQGSQTLFEERHMPGTVVKARQNYTWSLTPSGNPYVSAVLNTIDPGQTYEKISKTEQTLDAFGNMTQKKIYAYGNLVTPTGQYDCTYLGGTNYLSRYIRNRLVSCNATGLPPMPVMAYNEGAVQNVSAPIRQHDTTNYGPSFFYRGNPTAVTPPGGPTTNPTYNIFGMPATVQDAYGHSVAVTNSSSNNYAAPTAITPNSNPNLSTSMGWNSFLGLGSQSAANGFAASISYDSYARPLTATAPDGAVTSFTYTNSPPTKKATTNGHWTKTTFDGLGRTIKSESGYSTTTLSIVDSEYDTSACSPVGKLKRVSQPYAPGGTVYWTTYTYDGVGRTIYLSHPPGIGSTTVYEYAGNTVKTYDPTGRWKKFTMDVMGNLVTVNEPNPAGGADYVTNYTYNTANQLTQVSMPRNGYTQLRTFVYSNNRLTSATQPETGTVTYVYNADGSLQSKTDAKSQRTEYTHDGYRRVTQTRRFTNATTEDQCQRVDFTYDIDPIGGTGTPQYGYSRLATAQWGNVDQTVCAPGRFTEMYQYTQAGRIAKKRLRLTRLEGNPPVERSADLDATAAYNNEGSVTTLSYPTSYQWTMQDTLYTVPGETFTYTFDAMYRPTGLTGAGVSGVQYGPGGQMTVGPFGITRQYNERGQLTRIGNTVEYTYSATTNDGRITKQKDLVSGEEVNYQYDTLGRLSSASTTGPEWGLSFTYDGFGNRTAQTVTKGTAPSQTITADPATNRIGGMTYDLNGNATSVNGNTLSYDVANRLVSATNSPNGTEQYGYGPDNRRMWRRYGGAFDEFYFYGPTGQKIGAYKVFAVNGDCNQVPCGLYFEKITTFTYFGGMPLNGLRDRLGSDISGGKKYYPYGEERVVTANNVDKFATYYRDGHTGLDYADQRYYSNQYGRFLTPDPYQGSGGPSSPTSWNRFAYVLNDPVRYSDPDGLNPNDCSVVGCLMAPPEDGGGVIAFGTLGGSTFGQETAAAEAQHVLGVNNEFQANYANYLLQKGNAAGAAQIVAGNSNLTFTWIPNLQTQPGQTYQDTVTAYLKGLGVWDLINQETLKWTGTGYEFDFTNVSDAQNFLANNPMFASGPLGALHAKQTGFPNYDYRSWTTRWTPFSLQVNLGPDGAWADVDRYNPYTVWGFLLHAFLEVLPWWKKSIP